MRFLKIIFLIFALICPLMSTDNTLPSVNLSLNAPNDPKQLVTTLNVIALLTLLVLAPSLILVMTSFTRLIVVFSFLRTALGTQQTPPTQILVSLSLILTFFIMEPSLKKAYDIGIKPYMDKKISYTEAFEKSALPFKEFMLKNTREKDLALFLGSDNCLTPKPLMM